QAVPLGQYTVAVQAPGFVDQSQTLLVVSGSAPVLHYAMALASTAEKVTVTASPEDLNPDSPRRDVFIDQEQMSKYAGVDASNSFKIITEFVPGAYMVHDQLHVRGGHQVTWAIDGVPIPNTNIASNVGPQIDPKDIDARGAPRGGYSPAYGDRTYGVFNAVPRTGFERNQEGDLVTTFGTFHQTNDQLTFGSHTEKFAYYGSVNGNRSDYGLSTPGPDVLHDRVWGLGGMATLIYNRDVNNQFRLVSLFRNDDYQIPNDPDAQAAGIRDQELERDAVV